MAVAVCHDYRSHPSAPHPPSWSTPCGSLNHGAEPLHACHNYYIVSGLGTAGANLAKALSGGRPCVNAEGKFLQPLNPVGDSVFALAAV